MREHTLTRRVRNRDICLTVRRMGRDYLVAVAGGDAPHIGAVALADADGARRVERATHQEGDLAATLAERASARLGRCMAVVCGIHYEGITRPEIKAVLDAVQSMADEWLETELGGDKAVHMREP